MSVKRALVIILLSISIILSGCCFCCQSFINRNPSVGTVEEPTAIPSSETTENPPESFSSETTENPSSETAEQWYIKGNSCCFDKGDYAEGIKCFNKALELDPNYVDAWYGKGMALFDSGKYEECITSYEKALELEERYGGWYYKGMALHNLKKYEEAVECFDKALEIEPDDKEALKRREEALRQIEE